MAAPLHITVHVRWPWLMLAVLILERRLALFFVRLA
jgi:hypothetical protein